MTDLKIETEGSNLGTTVESRQSYKTVTANYLRCLDSNGVDVFPSGFFNDYKTVDMVDEERGIKVETLEKKNNLPVRVLIVKTKPDFVDALYKAFVEGSVHQVSQTDKESAEFFEHQYEYDELNRIARVEIYQYIDVGNNIMSPFLIKSVEFVYDNSGRLFIRSESEYGENTTLGFTNILEYNELEEGLEITEYSYSPIRYKDLSSGASIHFITKTVRKSGEEIAYSSFDPDMGHESLEGNHTWYTLLKKFPSQIKLLKNSRAPGSRVKNEEFFPEEITAPSYITMEGITLLKSGKNLREAGTDAAIERQVEVLRISEAIDKLNTMNIHQCLEFGDAIMRGSVEIIMPRSDWFSSFENVKSISTLTFERKIALLSMFLKSSIGIYNFYGDSIPKTLENYKSILEKFTGFDYKSVCELLKYINPSLISERSNRFIQTIVNIELIMIQGVLLDEWGENLIKV